MIYESLLNQLNNFGLLEDGVGIKFKSIPLVVNPVPMESEVFRITAVNILVDNSEDKSLQSYDLKECIIDGMTINTISVNNCYGDIISYLNEGEYSTNTVWIRISYLIKDDEKYVIIPLLNPANTTFHGLLSNEPIMMSNYETAMKSYCDSISIDVSSAGELYDATNDVAAIDDRIYPTDKTFFYATGGCIAAHTEIELTYTDQSIAKTYSAKINFALGYLNNAQ